MKKGWISLLLSGILLMTAGCGNSAPSSGASGAQSVVIARANDVVGLDPGFLTENAVVVDNIFDTLITRDKDEKLMPSLAESWKQIDDTTWEFKLKQGITFSNGEKFNAEAVKFSIDRVLNPENNAPTRSYISTIKEVKVVDDYTVDVITNTADPLIPTRFSRYPTEIVPPQYAEKVGQKEFAQKPVGTGPYELDSWSKGSQVILKENPKYWGDKPEVKKVTFRVIPEASTRVSALINREADIITDVPPSQIDAVKTAKSARLSEVDRGGLIVYLGMKTNEKPFNDVRVRQAMNYAVDVKPIADKVLNHTAVATSSIYGPKDFGYTGEPAGYEYNPEKAKALLAEAGYPNGFDVTLDTVNWYIKNTDVAQALAEQLKAVGIRVTVNNVESSVYRQTVPAGKQSFLYMLGWGSTNSLDADAAVYPILHSGQSYSTYSNPEVDSLLDEARKSLDPSQRISLYQKIQDLVIQDAPRVFLYQENKYYGVSRNIDWEGRIDASIPVKTIHFVQP